MTWNGFLPEHNCKRCGKPLHGQGTGYPAELYAGTYTGLCYPCTNSGAYVEKTYPLDGAILLNYPPHCPSWRRDRETYIAYHDCPDCKGKGMWIVSRHPGQGGSYPRYCLKCHNRFYSHPVRKRKDAYHQNRFNQIQQATTNLLTAHCAKLGYNIGLKKVKGLEKVVWADIRELPEIAPFVDELLARIDKARTRLNWAIDKVFSEVVLAND